MSKALPIDKNQSGLQNKGKPDFLAVAKIYKPHGLKGEVSAEILMDFPERLVREKQVYIGHKHLPVRINSIRKSDKKYLISFVGFQSIENVEKFRNKIIFIPKNNMPDLNDQEYYYHDLIGIEVFTTKDERVGTLSEILRTGANDVYVVQPFDKTKKELLLPAIKSVINKVDIQARKMFVTLQEWR